MLTRILRLLHLHPRDTAKTFVPDDDPFVQQLRERRAESRKAEREVRDWRSITVRERLGVPEPRPAAREERP